VFCWVKERIQIDLWDNVLNLRYCPPLLAFVVDVGIPLYPLFVENVVQPVDELAAPGWGKEIMGLELKQRSHYFQPVSGNAALHKAIPTKAVAAFCDIVKVIAIAV
jgi:hypothetical protein